MLNQYTYIDDSHRVALEAAIRRHDTITAALVAKMYKHALSAVTSGQASNENGFFHSRLTSGNTVIGTCTDARTGFFVQLVSHTNGAHHLLTMGQRWVLESADPMRGTINTLFW